MMTMQLPEGVYEQEGKLYRDVPRLAQLIVHEDGGREEVHDWIPREVILPIATDEESVEQARERAVRQTERGIPTDFLHPRLGWLRSGRKREVEPLENRGAGEVSYKRTSSVTPAAMSGKDGGTGDSSAVARKEKANGTR